MKTLACISVIVAAFWGFLLLVREGHPWGEKEQEYFEKSPTVLLASLKTFKQDVGRYPTSDEGLVALLKAPPALYGKWRGPYVSNAGMLLDEWGHAYRYRFPTRENPETFELWSLGADGNESTDDVMISPRS